MIEQWELDKDFILVCLDIYTFYHTKSLSCPVGKARVISTSEIVRLGVFVDSIHPESQGVMANLTLEQSTFFTNFSERTWLFISAVVYFVLAR